VRRLAPLAFAAAAAGCMAATAQFRSLPKPEQDRFTGCIPRIEGTLCSHASETQLMARCVDQAMAEYASFPIEEDRLTWLRQHGCPATP
jgi:hypothetical protein